MAREIVEMPFSARLVDASEEVGATHGRSGPEQLEHWARVGKSVSELMLGTNGRVTLALAGEVAIEDLGALERLVFNAETE